MAQAEVDLRFRLLRLLAHRPESSQRQIALDLGIALGRVNLLLRGLVADGLVLRGPHQSPGRRSGQSHWPTGLGQAELARLATSYLARKRAERAALRAEIAGIERDLNLGALRATARQDRHP